MASNPYRMLPLLINMSIDDLALGLQESRFTSVELVKVNGHLKVVAEFNLKAVEAAQQLDEERRSGNVRGPLHGIPILLKDAFANTDGLQAIGSSCLRDASLDIEATIIKKLKAAGVIILGTTNLTEWCNMRTKHAPHGRSANSGQCSGVYYPNQDPGGSSSGSATATAIALAAVSIGTETFGSITMPCQKSAVVGLKPTHGLVSRVGMIMVNEYQDTPGPIARTVKDAAYILQAIAGADPEDFIPYEFQFANVPDYPAACKPDGLSNVRVAAPSHIVTQDSEIVAGFDKTLGTLKAEGATVLTDIAFPEWTTSTRKSEKTVLDIGFQVLLKKSKLKRNPHAVKTLRDIIDYIKKAPDEENEEWGVTEFEAADALEFNTTSPEFQESMERRTHLGGDVDRLLDAHNCDVLVVPGSGDTPSELGGNPVIIVPNGFYSNDKPVEILRGGLVYRGPRVPYGVMFIGRKFSEEKLISCAYAYEQASKMRDTVQPCIQSNIEMGGPVESNL